MLSNDSFEFINRTQIKHWLWNALLQNSFQANIVFNDQLWLSSVEFGNCFRTYIYQQNRPSVDYERFILLEVSDIDSPVSAT